MLTTFAALLALLVSAAVIGPASAQSSKPWRHAVIEPKSDSGILMMAAQRGFFKKVGLDVEIIKVKDDELALKATISGDLRQLRGWAERRPDCGRTRRRCQGHRLHLADRAARRFRPR